MSPRARTAPGSAGGLLARALTATTVATLLGVLLGILPAVMAPAAVAATTTAPVAVTMNVGLAPWWNGDCDATRWGPIAASYGWKGVGSHRLGASYLGVPVCGPRPSVDGSPNVLWGRAGWGEAEWQCVELAQRFMAQVYGTKAFQANGSEVVAHYTTAMGGGLVKIANGTVGVAPVPGDIISFTTPKNPYGHVVVVTASSVDSNGNGSITVLSQNDTADGWRTLAVTAWKVATINTLTPYGWLHDPLGRGNPLGDGQFVQASDNSALYEIVGGAPLAVPAGTLPATTRVTRVDRPQISRLLAFPRNGTVIKDGELWLIGCRINALPPSW